MSLSSINPLSVLEQAANYLAPTLFQSVNIREFKSPTIYIKARCAISEKHIDRYEVTRHPTEMGVLISDHMFALPQEVQIQVGYSVSSNPFGAFQTAGAYLGLTDSPQDNADFYEQFLVLQSNRIPFTITTGKRQYKNMVILSIEENTEARTENSVFLNLHCQEIIIVNTSSYTSADLQADAPNTAAPVNTGSQSTSGPSTYSLPPNATVTSTGIL